MFFKSIEDAHRTLSPPVVAAIGVFDGVHVGHVQLVRIARSIVGDDGCVMVLTFDPHPGSVLHPEKAPQRLSTRSQRKHLLKEAGADEIVFIDPTPDFLNQEPQQFLTAIVDPHQPDAIIEGPDFRFGRHRAGSVETLRELESIHPYRTIVIDPVEMEMTDQHIVRVSSSIIRWLLSLIHI